MATSRAEREQACKDITRVLSRLGPRDDLRRMKEKKYPDVPRRTWQRWIEKVESSGAPAIMAARRMKRKAAQRAGQPEPEESMVETVTERLPPVIRPEDVAGTGLIPAMDIIQKCLEDARQVQSHCQAEDGRLRNPKLYIAASRHMLDVMRTASYVAKQLTDAQRIEQFHMAMLDEIRSVDPVVAERILDRLEKINREWGLV